MKQFSFLILSIFILSACDCEHDRQAEAQSFIDEYTNTYLSMQSELQEAEWKSNTYIVEGDSSNSIATRNANEALAAYTGSKDVIDQVHALMEFKDLLTPIQLKQLKAILYSAANNPATAKETVKARIKAETEQNENLFGFTFKMNGEEVTPNTIDAILKAEADLDKRLSAWEASKEVGVSLKSGLENLRNLRNETVQALDYNDYFTYQVSDYGMTVGEMNSVCKSMVKDIWPLYRELHTWARYELAGRYDAEVPEYLPAHWLPNRWGQDWGTLVEVEGINLDEVLEEKGREWLIEQAERFYVSTGFDELPEVFWENSSLYPAPEGSGWKKNNHASAWHVDLDQSVRCLMSVEPTAEWYETTHHELGHIYYFLEYSNPDVPTLLRGGANRGYHEAMGSLLGLAAMQKPFMEDLKLIEPGIETDDTKVLLKEALNYVVFMPWGAGVMPEFEHDLYVEDLSEDEFNKRWWELKKKYQGIVPPTERGEEYCDAASKTHINNDAAQYYDYAISYVLLFQFHDHIAKNILKQDPHATNYYGNKEVGKFLKELMYPGATVDGQELLKEKLGSEMSAKAMLDYFMPLMDYLTEVNEGREHTLPESPMF